MIGRSAEGLALLVDRQIDKRGRVQSVYERGNEACGMVFWKQLIQGRWEEPGLFTLQWAKWHGQPSGRSGPIIPAASHQRTDF